jgi:exosortase/archaeosortase family protein
VIGTDLPGSGAAVARARCGGAARGAAGIAILGLGVFLVVGNAMVRSWEAQVTAVLVRVLLRMPALPYRAAQDVVFFRAAPDTWAGIEITDKCTVAVFLVPLATVTGGLLLARRLQAWRLAVAGGAAAALMIVVNFVRILVIVAARCIGGERGFELAHTQLGTLLTIIGTAAAGFVFVRIGTGRGLRPLRTGRSSA